MWDLSSQTRDQTQPLTTTALAGGLLITGPPGSPWFGAFLKNQSSANEQGTQWVCFFLTLRSDVDRLVWGTGNLLL